MATDKSKTLFVGFNLFYPRSSAAKQIGIDWFSSRFAALRFIFFAGLSCWQSSKTGTTAKAPRLRRIHF